MDTKDCNKKAAPRINADALAQAAARAVERAQAARKTFTELDAGQTQQVSGGLAVLVTVTKPTLSIVKPPIIYGGFPLPVSVPVLY